MLVVSEKSANFAFGFGSQADVWSASNPSIREVAQLVAYTSGGRVVASSSLVFPTKKQGGNEAFVTTCVLMTYASCLLPFEA